MMVSAYHPQIYKRLSRIFSNLSKNYVRENLVKHEKKIVSYFKSLQINKKRKADNSIY